MRALTCRVSSSLPVESSSSAVVGVGLMGRCSRVSAARSSLCLLNLSTRRVSLERLVRITSLACVLLLELISKIVYKKTKYFMFYHRVRRKLQHYEISVLLSTVTHRFGFVAFDGINYLKALQFHFLQTWSWNKINQMPLATTVRVSSSLISS